MEMSQSEDELINVMETSVSEEPHFDEIEASSRMDVDIPSPSSLESVHKFEQSNFSLLLENLFEIFLKIYFYT